MNTGRQKMYANAHMYSVLILIPLQFVVLYTTNSPIGLILIALLVKLGRTFYFLKVISNDFYLKISDLLPLKLMLKISLPCLFFSILIKFSLLFWIENINYLLLLMIGGILYILLYVFYAYITKLKYYEIIGPLINRRLKILYRK